MQVEPMKPVLKAPGTKRLKLKCDGPVSSFAFNCILRRYSEGRKFLGERDPVIFGHKAGDTCAGCAGKCLHCD